MRVPRATGYDSNKVLSPSIQQLAEDGILLAAYYVFKFCSPSRSQMLTGRYAYHLGQQTYMNLNPNGARCGINTSYTMLPALLKTQGACVASLLRVPCTKAHSTQQPLPCLSLALLLLLLPPPSRTIRGHHRLTSSRTTTCTCRTHAHDAHARAGYKAYGLGKWHQGFFQQKYTPTDRGFDRFVGFYSGGEDHRTHVTSYGVYSYLPWSWTPADNSTNPEKGCKLGPHVQYCTNN